MSKLKKKKKIGKVKDAIICNGSYQNAVQYTAVDIKYNQSLNKPYYLKRNKF